MAPTTAPASAERCAQSIIKSPTDHRDYRLIRLSNGLRCALVHDAKSQQAAVSTAVHAGHFHDPQTAQGLAHFLEHMLFLGTAEFPEPEDYQHFVSQHGGSHNAWTGTEYSNYYFNIDPEFLEPALDRFIRFFYQPLFSQDWITKELQSVESEFQLKRKDELRRLYQVHKATVNPAHPFSKFSVGNLNTLQDTADNPLRPRLLEFFKTWYRPDRMTLVIIGPQSLEQLEALALNYGGRIPAAPQPLSEPTIISTSLYLPSQVGVELQVRPLKAAKRLILTFALPSIDQDYAHKTTSFIAHILGDEGPGSLFSELRHRHWVNSLAAGGGMSGSNFKDFNINMQLTEQGLKHVDDIICDVLALIRKVAAEGLEDWRYRERQLSVSQAFRFQEPARASDLAPQLAVNMHHYPNCDLIFGDYRMDGINAAFARELFECMQPDNMRVTLIHRQVETDQHEPIYGTDYAIQPLSEKRLERFRSAQQTTAELPKKNRFITDQLETQPLLDDELVEQPQFEAVTPGLRLWHWHDPDFRVPKAHIYTCFYLPEMVATPANFACARLWSELLLDGLNETCYDAEVAGLHFNIYPQQQGLTLHISGLSAATVPLAVQIIAELKTMRFEQKRWQELRQKLINNWRAAMTNKPMNVLFSRLNISLQPNTYAVCDLADHLEAMTFNTFEDWLNTALEPINADVFAHGDLQRQQLDDYIHALTDQLALHNRVEQADLKPTSFTELKVQPKARLCASLVTHHQDQASILALQSFTQDLPAQAAYLLLNQLMSPILFHELRTEQQLGYVVGTTYLPIQQVPHLLLYVQSSQYDADHLNAALVEFIEIFAEQLETLRPADFKRAQQAILAQLVEKDTNLRVRSQRLWSSITQNDHEFNRLHELGIAITNWQHSSFIPFAQQLLRNEEQQLLISTMPKNFDTDS
ncbi:peptidase M16 [Pseudidiomarina aestuarii]|uniref:Protease 3 n=3 Tax=Pseudidiomarina aestuarii TaxID=624146 RepID=A0A6N4DEZ8_9GAMM|nr:peptidase M16 [Pseudidiomarina aestuarii]